MLLEWIKAFHKDVMVSDLMLTWALITISFIYFIFIIAVILADTRVNKDKLSAVKMVSYFAILEAFVMLWFAINQTSLFNIVLAGVSHEYVTKENIIMAYIFSFISYGFLVCGVFVFSYKKLHFLLFLERWFLNLRYIDFKVFFPAFLMFCTGLLVYILFLKEVGGVVVLIDNMAMRTTFLIGKGGYIVVFSYLVLISGILISIYLLSNKFYLVFFLFFTIIILVEISAGSRWNVILYIFSILVVYHYTVNEFRSIFNIKFIFVGGVLIVILLFSLYLRESSLYTNSGFVNFVEQHLIQRYGVIERQVTVIGAFQSSSFWWGASYNSLLDILQLRSVNIDKLPIDTGVYLKALAEGYMIRPPMPANNLPATSWPPQNLSGYMNFGIVGYIVFSFISGMVLGLSYRLLIERKSSGTAILYSFFVFMGAVNLSPYGIFNMLIIIFFLGLFGLFYKSLRILGYR